MSDNDQDGEEIANRAVHYSLAKSGMNDVTAYLRGGRKHQILPDAALEDLFITTFKGWVAAVTAGTSNDHTALDEIGAEFQLRKIEPPYDKVSDEMATLTAKTKEVFERLTSDERDRIGSDIIGEYLDDLDKQQ
ncbi:hypothetical protein MesoLj131c_45520 [Mesorhizobium sp. 131-3-5]|uniref:hypothetical protein n=1 Tax=Mesorhizobium sp. 131-3-5 TaxID=2744520 RepID=UPI00192527D7|nr:hypothetical protein [Mesorhizobium sp. 131-3-5]BCH10294.1 hypothetical protein MesoLj131c_45520 [Mesorhizobium sp. 131-3-5]